MVLLVGTEAFQACRVVGGIHILQWQVVGRTASTVAEGILVLVVRKGFAGTAGILVVRRSRRSCCLEVLLVGSRSSEVLHRRMGSVAGLGSAEDLCSCSPGTPGKCLSLC